MHLSEIMSHPVVTCPLDSDLAAAAQLMWEYDVGALPVVDQDGRIAGIVTDRDIAMAAYKQAKLLEDVDIGIAMSKAPLVCRTSDTIGAVEALMRAGHIRRVPVVDDDRRPVGIVAVDNLARLAERESTPAVDREVVTTLAAICEPRTAIRRPPITPPSPIPSAIG